MLFGWRGLICFLQAASNFFGRRLFGSCFWTAVVWQLFLDGGVQLFEQAAPKIFCRRGGGNFLGGAGSILGGGVCISVYWRKSAACGGGGGRGTMWAALHHIP